MIKMVAKSGFMYARKTIRQVRNKFFPSEYELIKKKFRADGGEYKLRFTYNLCQESIVLDLGGYRGQWASDIFSRYRCRIFIFEVINDFSNRIKIRFRNNNKIEVFPYGLGGSSKEEYININAASSSVFRTSVNSEKIEIVDVKDWINNRGIDKIALIKINIEGGEYELLDRLIETKLIEKIENIQVQFHKISSSSRSQMERIQEQLKNTHKPTYQYEFVWENWTRNS